MLVNVEVQIVSSTAGHRVIATAGGQEVHRTIDYPDIHFAQLHAKELGERVEEFAIKAMLDKDC